MSQLSRAAASAAAVEIRDETGTGLNTATRIGTFLQNLIDSTVFIGEAETPPTAGNGLTGTTVFSVLPDGSSLTVSSSGVRLSDIAGNSVLGRASSSSGQPAAITGADGQALRVSGATLGFGTLSTNAYADGSVTVGKLADLAGLSLLGRSANTTGAPAAITGTDGQALRVSGTTLGFGQLAFAALPDGSACSVAGRAANSSGVQASIQIGTNNHVLMRTSDALTSGLIQNANVHASAGISNSKLSFDSAAIQFLSTVASPTISQATDATATVTGDTTTISAQDCSGTTAVTAGGMTIRAGNATGGSGTRNGGALSLASGTGATADGDVTISKGAVAVFSATTTVSVGHTSLNLHLNTGSGGQVNLRVNGTNRLQITSTVAAWNVPSARFDEAVLAPTIYQNDSPNNSAVGETLTIRAQEATGTGSTGGALTLRAGDATGASGTRTGGNVIIRPGTGASAEGSLTLRSGGNTTRIQINATGLGFFGVTPVARPDITGSRGANAALADLLTKGALLGLWTDSSS